MLLLNSLKSCNLLKEAPAQISINVRMASTEDVSVFGKYLQLFLDNKGLRQLAFKENMRTLEIEKSTDQRESLTVDSI